MGYVAYAAGTLIVAVAIHSLLKRNTNTRSDVDPITTKTAEKAQSIPKIATDIEHTRNVRVTLPPISIEISHDEDQTSTSNESDDSPLLTPRRVLLGTVDKDTEKRRTRAKNAGIAAVEDTVIAPTEQPTRAVQQSAAMPPPSMPPPSRRRSPPRLKPATASSLVPPARGPPARQGGFTPPTSLNPTSAARAGALRPPQSSSLGVPQQKILANTHMQPSLAPTTSTQAPSKRSSKKVLLAPGHSPLDWAALTKSMDYDAPRKLRGKDASDALGPYRLGRVTPSQLKKQTGRKGKDAWTSYQGRVYNISAYLNFHPGGLDELMKGAGRSSDSLFAEVHPWVNWEGMLGGCLIGMLVSEDDPQAMGREVNDEVTTNELDEMD